MPAGYALWQWQRAGGEQVSLRSGTSAWFFFVVSLVAILLCFHQALKSFAILWRGEADLKRGYFASATEPPHLGWKDNEGLLLAWDIRKITWLVRTKGGKERLLRPEPLWQAFRKSGRFESRILRATFTTLIICLGMLLISFMEPFHFMPLRGYAARVLCIGVEALSLFTFIWLGMLILDSLWLNRIFIDWFGKGTTLWRWRQLKLSRSTGLTWRHRCDYTDLRLIADWTRDIGRLTALPFYGLALLVLARLNYFDAWRWPWHVVAALVLTAVLVILGSYRVHLAAVRLRQATLALLAADHLTLDDKAPVKALMDKVQQLSHGAFMPFLKQPVMEAVYWFVSAVSISGLLQQLSQVLS